jgi:hypothetical protein
MPVYTDFAACIWLARISLSAYFRGRFGRLATPTAGIHEPKDNRRGDSFRGDHST